MSRFNWLCHGPLMGGAAIVVVVLALDPLLRRSDAGAVAGASRAQPPSSAAALEAALIEKGEPILPFERREGSAPLDPRKVEALSYYGAGRVREQDEDFAAALRLYQRAHRKDPLSLPVLQRIVPLALHLDHDAEAIRYTLKAVGLGYDEPLLLSGFASHLTDEGRWADALTMYDALLPSVEENTAAYTALRAEMGRLNYLVERYDQAAGAFTDVLAALEEPAQFGLNDKQVAALLGNKAVTQEMFADTFLKAKRWEQAETLLDALSAEGDDQLDHDYHRARLLYGQGEVATALDALRTYLASHPSNRLTQPYQLLDELLGQLNRGDELQGMLEALLTEAPDNVPLLFHLAGVYREAGDTDRAIELLDEVVATEPFVEAFLALVALCRERDDVPRLAAVLGQIVEVGGELSLLGDELVDDLTADTELLDRLYQVVEANGGNTDDANTGAADTVDADDTDTSTDTGAADTNDADTDTDSTDTDTDSTDTDTDSTDTDTDSTDTDASYGRPAAVAWLAANSGDVARAETFFRRAVQLNSDSAAEFYSQWGIGLLMAEEYDAACDVFNEAIDRKLTSAENPIFSYLGSGALVMAERYDEALEAARHAAEINQENPRLASRVAWVLYQADRFDEATEAYTQLVTQLEDNRGSEAVRDVLRDARLVLSNLALEAGDRPRAEEWLEEILDEFPDDISAKNDLGYLWVERAEHLEEALAMILEAVASDPDNRAYLDSLGWAYYQLGRYDEAVSELTKAAAGAAEPDGVILDHLGDALDKAGRPAEAQSAWQRAAQAFDTADDREKLEGVRAKLSARSAAPDE